MYLYADIFSNLLSHVLDPELIAGKMKIWIISFTESLSTFVNKHRENDPNIIFSLNDLQT
jgi:hypothetical protein